MQYGLSRYAALAVLALGAVAMALPAVPVLAQKNTPAPVKKLGESGAWEAYVDDAPGGKICFVIGKPKKVDAAHAKPDDVRMSVTHRPSDKVANVVNFILGYKAKGNSDAVLDIDGKKFPLFTDKDGAWTRDAATDRAVVIALTRGRDATIKAEPERGKPTADTYDLSGFTAAVQMIDKACGVKR
ncbi:MAG TPA: invasion associated locus B family protein [Stellaceae bacterium]|nr:invasion associated locus B family protein [Stellaceae bacterium]